jgi:hypothetical protein
VTREPSPTLLLAKSDRVPSFADGWPQEMLAFLLAPLATDARRGSAFGEFFGDEIELRVTLAGESMLTKSHAVVRRRPIALGKFLARRCSRRRLSFRLRMPSASARVLSQLNAVLVRRHDS